MAPQASRRSNYPVSSGGIFVYSGDMESDYTAAVACGDFSNDWVNALPLDPRPIEPRATLAGA